MSKDNVKKIILSGGGTGGSVTPLLAMADYLKNHSDKYNYSFLFIGTSNGPERDLVEKEGIFFESILSGKWRRYFSIKNFIDIFKIIVGFFQSLILLKKSKPDLMMSAGGFISVPLTLAAYFFKIPILIHQQDILPGLANKIMSKLANRVTVTFEKSLNDYGKKAIWVGNPTKEIGIKEDNLWSKYEFNNNKPLIVILGGGTGSVFINQLVKESLNNLLLFSQILHICGSGKKDSVLNKEGYKCLEFMEHDELLWFIDRSILAVSRCGLGVLTELAHFSKPAIIIPMPHSHQEDNASFFSQQGAVLVLDQEKLTPEIFILKVRELLDDENLRKDLSLTIGKTIKSANFDLKNIIDNML